MAGTAGVWVWCELVCYTCAETICGRFTSGSHIPRSQMVKEARATGWVIGTKSDNMYCSRDCRHKKEG